MAKKTKAPKKPKVPRTRNHGTMTEAAFWAFIRSSLRRRTMVWKPIKAAKDKARIPYVGSNKRRKWSYVCSQCEGVFADTEIEVDHIVEAGSLRCAEDLAGFVERLFCEAHLLVVLCKDCHKKKTHGT